MKKLFEIIFKSPVKYERTLVVNELDNGLVVGDTFVKNKEEFVSLISELYPELISTRRSSNKHFDT